MQARSLIFALALVGIARFVSGQETPTVILGGQTLRVGMSEGEALSKLAVCCIVSKTDNDEGGHFVSAKGMPYDLYGGVWFADGKLFAVKRDRDHFVEGPALNVGQSLYRWFSEVAHSGSAKVTVQVLTTEGKNLTIRSLKFQLPDGRSLVLDISKVDANNTIPDFMSIDELYEYPTHGSVERPQK